MVEKALYVRLEAKPGFETKVEEFLKSALPLVEAEPSTKAWFAIKMGPMTYGIFDVFPDRCRPRRPSCWKGCGCIEDACGRAFSHAASDRKDRRGGSQASMNRRGRSISSLAGVSLSGAGRSDRVPADPQE